jgi:hypothetical protein
MPESARAGVELLVVLASDRELRELVSSTARASASPVS